MSELFFWSRAGVKPQMLRGATFQPGELVNWGLPSRINPPPPSIPLTVAQSVRLALWPFFLEHGFGKAYTDFT